MQPSHLLSSPSPPALNLSQHQALFQWVSSLDQGLKYWSGVPLPSPDKPRQCIKKQRHHFANKGSYSESHSSSSSHVQMWGLDYKDGWAPKNKCLQIVVLKKTLESPLDSKEIKPGSLKGNQLWIFIGRTDAEAEAPILWPPVAKSQLIGKEPDAGKDWRQKEKRAAEDEMVRQDHLLNGHEFEQTPGDSGGQRSLVCCHPWSHKESDMT